MNIWTIYKPYLDPFRDLEYYWNERNGFCFKECLNFMGHVIQPGRLDIPTKPTDSTCGLQHHINVTELKLLLGLCNVFWRFVTSFILIATLLKRKQDKFQPFPFRGQSHIDIQGLEMLHIRMLSLPILAIPRPSRRYTFDTSTCEKHVGHVLQHVKTKGQAEPLGYLSPCLYMAEKVYNTTRSECLAYVWAVLLLRPYIEGSQFTI